MKLKTTRKIFYILLLFLPVLACIVLGVGFIYYLNNQRLGQEKVVLEGISKRTGLSPDWLSVRTYVYCELLKPGTSRAQVEKGLALIGQFKSPDGGDLSQQINFVDPSIYFNLSPLILRYDKKWYLISSGAGEFNHGPRANCEIERAKNQTPNTTAKGKIIFSYWNGKDDIYIMNADGSELKDLTPQLTVSSEPAWSPNGQYIAFTSSPEDQIYTMRADGTEPTQLTFGKIGSFSPTWSPDGKYILFLSARDVVLSNNKDIPYPEVYIMKSDGSEQRRLTNNQALNISSLSWSPKGDLIAATIGDPAGGRYSIEIYLMDLNGVIQKQLTTLGINEYPKWSPDGKFIVYHSIGMDNCSGISFMKADGSDQVCLVIDKAFPPVQNINPSWSSDGRYIVFSSNLDGNYDLYMVKADGSGLTQLTNLPGDENVPSWSPLQ